MSRPLSYKIWKHFNKKYGCKNQVSNSSLTIELSQLQKEFYQLKLFITSALLNKDYFDCNSVFNKQMFNIFNQNYLSIVQERTFDNLVWRQTSVTFEELNRLFYSQFLSSTNKWTFFPKYIRFLLIHGDLLSNLEDVFEDNIENINLWSSDTVLRYLSFCILNNNEDKAFDILKMYVEKYAYKNLSNFLPVAAFAANHGINDKNINKASDMWNKINEYSNLFEEIIKGKRVALVGNGPIEKGKGQGSIIDSYDVVIRMNKYIISPETINDYGKKVTIWVNCEKLPDSIELKGDFKAFFWLCYFYADPFYSFIADQKKLYTSCKVSQIDMIPLWREVYNETGIYCPSNGLNLIYLIKKINPYFSADDCFGFSFKENNLSENPQWMHYAGETLSNMPHDLNKEQKAILKILGE